MITEKGAYVTAGSGLAVLFGLALGAAPLFALGLLGLMLVAVTSFYVETLDLAVTRKIPRTTIAEDEILDIELTVANRRAHGQLFFELQDQLPSTAELVEGTNFTLLDLAGGESARLDYAVKFPVKGRNALGPVRVRLEDPFGIHYKDTTFDAIDALTVHPKQEDIKTAMTKSKYPLIISGDYQVGQPGLGSDFFALRDYIVGDSIRDIDWKASARTKGLVVKQRERESYALVTMILDTRAVSKVGTMRHNSLVYGARAAASIASYLFDRRDKLRFVTYGEAITEIQPTSPDRQMPEILDALTAAEGAGQQSLNDVVDKLLPTLRPKTPVVLIGNLLADPTIDEAIRKLLAYKAKLIVFSPNPVSFDAETYGSGAVPAETRIMELERETTMAAIRGYGVPVLDWKTGEPLSIVVTREVAAR
ncbi:MAG: DUF58 domain-containing protein [Euryarchaeota archaeon]|nr:DUF58 domain-containing protein [Euryarchaeota archaeon]